MQGTLKSWCLSGEFQREDQEIREELSTAQRLHSKCKVSTQRRQGLLKLAGYHQDLQPVGYVCWTLDECGKGDQQLPGLLYNEPMQVIHYTSVVYTAHARASASLPLVGLRLYLACFTPVAPVASL